jgi:AraC family transcriptional regulator
LKGAVERVVDFLYEQYDQPISLADMADVAILSQYHFARTFRDVTGVSPGRFLSAIRLHRAKGLLLGTSLTVTDISYMVGYNSLGTFTSRFTRSVGMSPMRFRRLADIDPATSPQLYEPDDHTDFGTLTGHVSPPPGAPTMRFYLGVFDNPIVQGMPVSCAMLDDTTAFQLNSVPEGEWYVLAAGVDMDHSPVNQHGARMAQLVAREGPVKVVGGRTAALGLDMRKARPTDPPILLATLGLDNCAQSVVTVV